ncbi:HNH endonuclease [Aquimarina amphilecti]|uniref:HNH endonuclease n=1 Tax=Aquimarina amphilecti TaxID=1038014 RepID=A0A1H7R1U9_AQUAM|nr:HNH endonuclease [Aquimarina amphilecti]
MTKENFSTEHIILNACGGKLKSDSLLCKKCNSSFGDSFDKELAKTITPLANLLRIKRDRGTPPKINGLDILNNTEYILDHNGAISHKKPSIQKIDFDNPDISKRKFQIKVPNQKMLKQVLNGLKRKHPDLDVEKALEELNQTEEPFDKELEIKMSFGGTDTFKSIIKTAINFYILNGGERNEIKHLFEFLDGNKEMNNVWFHYPDKDVYNYKEGEITHIIKLKGNKNEKILYAYIELFNSHCFIIKLNENYTGKDLNVDYIFNIHNHKIIDESINLNLKRQELLDLFINKNANFTSKVQEKLNRILQISKKNDLKNEISKSVNKIFTKNIGKKVDDVILKELENEFFKIIKPHINYKTK